MMIHCENCKNKDICKYVKDAELTKKAIQDVSKLLEAEHFNISVSCPNFMDNNIYR